MPVVERRKNEDRRGGEAREERNYSAARRRIIALEKALDLIVTSLVPGEHGVDQRKLGQYRQGIDVARALLGRPAPDSGRPVPDARPTPDN